MPQKFPKIHCIMINRIINEFKIVPVVHTGSNKLLRITYLDKNILVCENIDLVFVWLCFCDYFRTKNDF